jgi:aerobic carbon-monoxide dehydrogenase small subunit
MLQAMRVALRVDGQVYEVASDPGESLLALLRERLGCYGVKEGCGTGSCGACTVLRDGYPVLSCLLLAFDAAASEITTVAGLHGPDGELHPLQQAFIDHHAVQCGFCTPGILMAAKALLDTNRRPTEAEVRVALSGNLCRCTGYVRIVTAVLAAAEQMTAAGAGEGADERSG